MRRLILAPGRVGVELFKIDWLPLEVEPQQLHWFDPRGGPAPFSRIDFRSTSGISATASSSTDFPQTMKDA